VGPFFLRPFFSFCFRPFLSPWGFFLFRWIFPPPRCFLFDLISPPPTTCSTSLFFPSYFFFPEPGLQNPFPRFLLERLHTLRPRALRTTFLFSPFPIGDVAVHRLFFLANPVSKGFVHAAGCSPQLRPPPLTWTNHAPMRCAMGPFVVFPAGQVFNFSFPRVDHQQMSPPHVPRSVFVSRVKSEGPFSLFPCP